MFSSVRFIIFWTNQIVIGGRQIGSIWIGDTIKCLPQMAKTVTSGSNVVCRWPLADGTGWVSASCDGVPFLELVQGAGVKCVFCLLSIYKLIYSSTGRPMKSCK